MLILATAFTYQGALSDANGPANGLFEMTFGLFPTDVGSDAVATVTNTSVEVANGLFTTTLDFGAAVFDGTDYRSEDSPMVSEDMLVGSLTGPKAMKPLPIQRQGPGLDMGEGSTHAGKGRLYFS